MSFLDVDETDWRIVFISARSSLDPAYSIPIHHHCVHIANMRTKSMVHPLVVHLVFRFQYCVFFVMPDSGDSPFSKGYTRSIQLQTFSARYIYIYFSTHDQKLFLAVSIFACEILSNTIRTVSSFHFLMIFCQTSTSCYHILPNAIERM